MSWRTSVCAVIALFRCKYQVYIYVLLATPEMLEILVSPCSLADGGVYSRSQTPKTSFV